MKDEGALTTRLRRKIVLLTTAALAVTLALLCLVINGGVAALASQRADGIIDLLHEEGELVPDSPDMPGAFEGLILRVTSETPFETRYLIASYSKNGQITSLDLNHIASLDEAAAEELAQSVLSAKSERGQCDSYRYAVFPDADGGGTIILLDTFQQQQACLGVLAISIGASVVCLLIVFAALIPLSRLIAKPFETNILRQRRFVTDASHELKTPLAIIAANNDLLEAENGPTRWSQSTREQVARLNALVGNLIDSARAEEPLAASMARPVDLAEAARRSCAAFAPFAETLGKTIAIDATEPATVDGSPEDLARLCDILIDNALRHSDEQARVVVAVQARHRTVTLSVANPCRKLGDSELDEMFVRFWRADSSRAHSSGGYGIGLSLAQTIAERHGGRIKAEKNGDTVHIAVTLARSSREPHV